MKFVETKNNLPTTKPLKEIMSLNVPNVNTSLPYKNGAIYAIIGAPGQANLIYYFQLYLEIPIIIEGNLIIYI